MGYKTSRFELRLTTREKEILKRKAKKVGLIVSDFVRSSLIHSDNLTINVIDTSVLSKTLFELHKHGVNLNQLMKFCNTSANPPTPCTLASRTFHEWIRSRNIGCARSRSLP